MSPGADAATVPLAIAPGHAAFAGHFPGNPVLPAVVLLAEVLANVARATSIPVTGWTVSNAKFLAPVGPGVALELRHEPSAAGVRFEIRAGAQVVASGVLARKETSDGG